MGEYIKVILLSHSFSPTDFTRKQIFFDRDGTNHIFVMLGAYSRVCNGAQEMWRTNGRRSYVSGTSCSLLNIITPSWEAYFRLDTLWIMYRCWSSWTVARTWGTTFTFRSVGR